MSSTPELGNICLTLISLLLAGTVLRVVQLKLHPDARLADAAGTTESTLREPGRRGDLLDRRGRILATTTLGHRAFLDPREVDDLATIGIELKSLIGLDAISIDRALARRFDTRFVPISDILEAWQVDRLKQEHDFLESVLNQDLSVTTHMEVLPNSLSAQSGSSIPVLAGLNMRSTRPSRDRTAM